MNNFKRKCVNFFKTVLSITLNLTGVSLCTHMIYILIHKRHNNQGLGYKRSYTLLCLKC